MERFQQVLPSIIFFSLVVTVGCEPPADPINCTSGNTDCTITNGYGTFPDRSICKAENVQYPKTLNELISVVANATKENKKMKVATRYSHSIPKLVCPDGEDGVLISTNDLTQMLHFDASSETMTVESGMTLRQLIDHAAYLKLTLPYTPYWWGLTIGGLLSTGAHGSTLWGNGSSVHDYVVALTIVTPAGPDEGHAKVRNLDNNDSSNEFNAAKVSLGVLGVIYKVSLKLQPMFKRSIAYEEKDDADLENEAVKFGGDHEFADIIWYLSKGKAVYRLDDRDSSNSSANGVYNFYPFRPTELFFLEPLREQEEEAERRHDDKLKCDLANLTIGILSSMGYGLQNDGKEFKGYPVIGYNNRVQSSGTCLDSPINSFLKQICAWDPRYKGEYFFENGYSIKLSNVSDFIKDVKELVKLKPEALCGLDGYNGILMRYVKASSAYLGKQEDSMNFDITYYRSKDPMVPRLHQDIFDEIEQIAILKYQALPHWGKNRNVAFDKVIEKYKNAEEFLKVKMSYDPNGLFSNEWTDQVLGIKGSVTITKEGCALEGLCICSEDIHCAPSKFYFCRPGKIYDKARVCTFDFSKEIPLRAMMEAFAYGRVLK